MPLIGHTDNPNAPMTSTRPIRRLIQSCFDQAADVLESQGEKHEATLLCAATVHWLRHTGISEDVKIRPREHVRDDAGHSSSAITDRYNTKKIPFTEDNHKNIAWVYSIFYKAGVMMGRDTKSIKINPLKLKDQPKFIQKDKHERNSSNNTSNNKGCVIG